MNTTIEYFNEKAQKCFDDAFTITEHANQDRFLSYLKPGAELLDFGCGSGRDTAYFREKGFAVTSTDGAAELARLASAYLQAPVKVMEFNELDEEDRYDGIYAMASIMHLEYEKLLEDDEQVVACKKLLLQSKVYERGLKKLRADKPWGKYDAIMAFAEWGLTRDDIGGDIDAEVFGLIESTGFRMLCGEPLLLRNLVKLGYYPEDIVKNEIGSVLGTIQDDGGFGCISTNKKMNNPNKPHKSCARLTAEYLLLAAELRLAGHRAECEDALVRYFTKRNIFYRTDDMKTPMVDVMTGTFYPPDPIKIGAHNIVYALRVLGCDPSSEAMQAGYGVLNRHRLENGRYLLTASKSVPAFKAGNVGEENKWITLYAYMAQE